VRLFTTYINVYVPPPSSPRQFSRSHIGEFYFFLTLLFFSIYPTLIAISIFFFSNCSLFSAQWADFFLSPFWLSPLKFGYLVANPHFPSFPLTPSFTSSRNLPPRSRGFLCYGFLTFPPLTPAILFFLISPPGFSPQFFLTSLFRKPPLALFPSMSKIAIPPPLPQPPFPCFAGAFILHCTLHRFS